MIMWRLHAEHSMLGTEKVKRDIVVLSGLRQQLRKRALKCIEQGGGHFESVLKRRRRLSAEY